MYRGNLIKIREKKFRLLAASLPDFHNEIAVFLQNDGSKWRLELTCNVNVLFV